MSPTSAQRDAYLDYIHRFFGRWVRLYDGFARAIAPIYGAAVRAAGPVAGLHVLDLCTGTGEVADRCARAGARVTAIDVTDAMLDRARRKCRNLPVRFLHMDARHLDFPDDTFDVAVLSFALHDMPRRARGEVLAEAGRVTRRKLIVLDYELPRWQPARALVRRLVASFETAYFPRFADEGGAEQLSAADLGSVRLVRRFPPFFAIWSVDLR
jgi:demethylmenaquinone methyltransferase/2-methoxy-6-polyprenyl-1,4-benzoquinol methylase